jgi:hypothetical protein
MLQEPSLSGKSLPSEISEQFGVSLSRTAINVIRTGQHFKYQPISHNQALTTTHIEDQIAFCNKMLRLHDDIHLIHFSNESRFVLGDGSGIERARKIHLCRLLRQSSHLLSCNIQTTEKGTHKQEILIEIHYNQFSSLEGHSVIENESQLPHITDIPRDNDGRMNTSPTNSLKISRPMFPSPFDPKQRSVKIC